MLVLTRKSGEAIHIGDRIVLRVLGVESRAVKIGIEAPPEIAVYRAEVYARILEENRRAALPASGADLGAIARLFQERRIPPF